MSQTPCITASKRLISSNNALCSAENITGLYYPGFHCAETQACPDVFLSGGYVLDTPTGLGLSFTNSFGQSIDYWSSIRYVSRKNGVAMIPYYSPPFQWWVYISTEKWKAL
jgi:hypothetical protein